MDEMTRQHVLVLIRQAQEEASKSIRTALERLPPEERHAVDASIEEFKACLQRQFDGTMQPNQAQARIAALIYGHLDASAVQVMEHYAQALSELLGASRDRLIKVERRRDN